MASGKEGGDLYVFDFDHTIVEHNSDLVIMDLHDGYDGLPEEVKKIRSTGGWTAMMNEAFRFLHSHGISAEQMIKKVASMALTPGMKDLLRSIQEKLDENPLSRLVIASDANDVFIKEALRSLDMPLKIDKIISNPATITDIGTSFPTLFQIAPFDSQSSCDLCPVNMCKGKAITDFIKENGQGPFRKTVFIADGGNDLCLSLQLLSTDVVCPRSKFALERMLRMRQNNDESRLRYDVKAHVEVWEDAQSLIQYI